jgi:hypothetical protein
VLEKVFESLYYKVFVNIVQKRASTLVYVELYSKKGIVQNAHEEFDTLTPNESMIEFIENFTKESPYYYIAVLDMSHVQGALPTCDKNRLSYYEDLSGAEYKCYDKKWTYYTLKSELYEIEKTYKPFGVDFIFSPFTLLATFFKDKITQNLALYALVQDSFVSIAVFENSQLLFAEHLDLQTGDDAEDILLHETLDDDLDMDLEDDGIDLENLDVEEHDENLEDFGDIEDLDSLEDIDEFSDNKDIEEELLESDTPLDESNEGEFNEDYQRFSLIQTSIAHYYKDDRYESKFIENIYIADSIGVSSDLKRYLEEEMFLNVYIRQADITAEVCELTKEELGL